MTKVSIQQALALRQEGKLHESNRMFCILAEENPNNAVIQSECGGSFDLLGDERAAIPYYEKAISLGLTGEALLDVYVCLGSSYRVLGAYDKAASVLQKGLTIFPDDPALHAFYAITLYNLGEHKEALTRMLTCLTDTSTDPRITAYSQALAFYAKDLDKVWS
ncbi:tetratricopeptide repeat protein [Shouchella lonarensis]|uniref:Tetratrico peptide repeat-containing protein n=1 Tax=Shouchella lonarensis TaxID=1464122 RepID=A0A1G6GY28_9BACI|nr:tetratricopeptide repeat protein [Shouchella lonarensis]SDB86834.1 Tetratrico peptide repeat-containing protein [Shouchella lonarensis]